MVKLFLSFGVMSALILSILLSTPAANELIDEVKARYSSINTISAKFIQYSLNKASAMREQSSGTVYISKPGKMRWEYVEPEKRLIVSDGEKVWAYLPEQGQVYVSRFNDAYLSRTPFAFFVGKGNLKDEFTITYSVIDDKDRGTIHVLDLKPHKPRMNLSRLVLNIDKKSLFIIKSDLYDLMGNLISIEFREISVDPDIPQTLFEFSPPDGVEVIQIGDGN